MTAFETNVSRELAQSVIERSERFGRDCFTEERHDEHESHDDSSMHEPCVHCAIYRYHMSGHGHVVALMQLAQWCIDNDQFYRREVELTA